MDVGEIETETDIGVEVVEYGIAQTCGAVETNAVGYSHLTTPREDVVTSSD